MGRAFRMRKRSNHVTIVVAAKEEKAKPVQPTKKAAKPAAEKKEVPKKKAAPKTAKPAKPAAKESK
jgi:TPP-dependent indolepyruvate ferredoxin oxidoreductase alpha subunit